MYTCKQIELNQSYKAAILKVPNHKYPALLPKYLCITNFKMSTPCHKNIVPVCKSNTVPLSSIVKKSNFLNVNVVKSNKFKQVNHNLISHRRVKAPSSCKKPSSNQIVLQVNLIVYSNVIVLSSVKKN